jgi:predicted nucleotidyltransferase
MEANRAQIIETLKRLKPLLAKEGIDQLALFGSFAREEATPYSDVDIAFRRAPFYRKEQSAYDYFILMEKLKSDLRTSLHRNVDLFDLDSDSPFRVQIEKELIYV